MEPKPDVVQSPGSKSRKTTSQGDWSVTSQLSFDPFADDPHFNQVSTSSSSENRETESGKKVQSRETVGGKKVQSGEIKGKNDKEFPTKRPRPIKPQNVEDGVSDDEYGFVMLARTKQDWWWKCVDWA